MVHNGEPHSGLVALLGSGETSTAGGQVFETLVRRMRARPRIRILETPAGFELNANRVAGRVADFLKVRLQNYRPQIELVPARKRGTQFSPDDPKICAPILEADLVFFGPGSPTYTVRQLENSKAWEYVVARQRLGATLVLASAATIALGCNALPVYEIYKVGEDPVWKNGLCFFEPYGLDLILVPHWNNSEGGSELDTSRCFIGKERFDILASQLSSDTCIVGLDEHTALILDLEAEICQVLGRSNVHVIRNGQEEVFSDQDCFPIGKLGPFHPLKDLSEGFSAGVFEKVKALQDLMSVDTDQPSQDVLNLVDLRLAARLQRNWAESDRLRAEIARLGWKVVDTAEGQQLVR